MCNMFVCLLMTTPRAGSLAALSTRSALSDGGGITSTVERYTAAYMTSVRNRYLTPSVTSAPSCSKHLWKHKRGDTVA